MTTKNANIIRAEYLELISALMRSNTEEDIMRVSSGSIAFPVVAADGEEGWVEIVIKIPKWVEDDDGYSRAETYKMDVAEKLEKAKEKEAAKQVKIEKDKAKREAKKKKGDNN